MNCRYRLALLEALLDVVRLDPPAMLARVTAACWHALTELFFELRYNSIYQRIYADLVQAAVHADCRPALLALLQRERLAYRLADRYGLDDGGTVAAPGLAGRTADGQRGYVLRLANVLRLRAQLSSEGGDVVREALEACDVWSAFEPRLRDATLLRHRQVHSHRSLHCFEINSLFFEDARQATTICRSARVRIDVWRCVASTRQRRRRSLVV